MTWVTTAFIISIVVLGVFLVLPLLLRREREPVRDAAREKELEEEKHPGAAMLEKYALERDRLPNQVVIEMAAHLKGCRRCTFASNQMRHSQGT